MVIGIRKTPGKTGAKTKKCPICKLGRVYQKCTNCGAGFKGKPRGCKKCGMIFTTYNWTCGHRTPYR